MCQLVITTDAKIGCLYWSHHNSVSNCHRVAVIANPGLTACWQPVQAKVERRTEAVVEELVDAAGKLAMFKQAGVDNAMRDNLVIMCEESYLH